MKKLFFLLCACAALCTCKRATRSNGISDGFYEVIRLGNDHQNNLHDLPAGLVTLKFDTLFNPDNYSAVVVDTTDYVPLELHEDPVTEPQSKDKRLLSVSFNQEGADKIRAFTAKRIMKEVVIVLDGKAITMHKIRDTIRGPKMQITRCGDNACDYLFIKLKKKVKR